MAVQRLPHGVIKVISSTQVISSVSSVVKELIENSLDAEASVVDIKLEKTGLEKIEIRDNGHGISKADAHNVCLPNYTSKLYSYEDLEKLESYGFRGEALNSLCAVAQVSITTKTESDEIASTYTYDNNGTVREVQPSHYMKGTIVSVTNLFKNVPVRRQYYENTRKATEELKRIEKVVKLLSVIHPKLRVTLAHNKCLIWQKTSVYTLRQSLMQVYPHVVLKNLVEFKSTFDDVTVEMLICKRDCNWSVLCQPQSEAVLFFVNKRPVIDKKVDKVVIEEMTHLFTSTLPHNKCPLTLISLSLSPQNLDVNVEPDKSKIFMKNHEEILKQIRESIMLHFYEQPLSTDTQEHEQNINKDIAKKRKTDDFSNDLVLQKRIQYDDVTSVRLLPRSSSTDISTCNGENSNLLVNDLSGLDASVFEENSGENERLLAEKCVETVENPDYEKRQLERNVHPDDIESFSAEKSVEIAYSGLEKCQLEVNMHSDDPKSFSTETFIEIDKNSCLEKCPVEKEGHDSVNESTESQQSLSFDIPFGSLENGNVESDCLRNFEKAGGSINCVNDLNFFNTSRSIENEFKFNLDLPEDSSEDLKNNSPSISESKADLTSEKVLNQTTLSQWSKGLVNVEGKSIQGGAIIANVLNTRLTKENPVVAHKSEKRSNSNDTFTPLSVERSVSSQMGRKDLAGLTNFARTVRSEIIKENPGISFTRVANELANRWRNLKDDEKDMFSKKSKEEKNRKTNNTNAAVTPLVKKTYISVKWSVDDIKNQLKNLKSPFSRNYTSVIGPLRKESEWVCKIGNNIVAVHIHQLKKNVLIHRDLSHMSIPSQILDVPLEINASIINTELWDVLLSLEKCQIVEPGRFIISDPRILKNGFKIIIEEEFLNKFKAVIMEAANECRSAVVEAFIETLKLIQMYNDVQNCRPTVIKRYISANISLVQDCITTNPTEIEELLAYWVQQMAEISVYPSELPTTIQLYRFSKKTHFP